MGGGPAFSVWPWVESGLANGGAAFRSLGGLTAGPAVRSLSGGVDVQGVKARCEFGLEGVVDGPVLRQPGEPGEGCRADFDGVMRFAARCCASMTVVQMRLVHYIELIR